MREQYADPNSSLRLRAPFLGLVLAVIICLLTPYNNMYLRATPLAAGTSRWRPFSFS